MRTLKVLEMLNNGKIEELRAQLQDEVYQDSLKTKPNERKRYIAMKKYFTYTNMTRECLTKPCKITFEGKDYTSFTNSWSLALTTEPTGEIELFDEENGKYPDIGRLIRFDGVKGKINMSEVIARARTLGYKLTKSEVNPGFRFLMHYDGTYYKLGLLDATYSIIDDGEIATTYHPYGDRMPLTIQTSIGICMIMPVKFQDEDIIETEHVVIKVE